MLKYMLIALAFISSIQAGISQTPAFPTAMGYGKNATGGRGGTVYHVTNLNDSGPGSFRDAVSVSNRIIVFDVSGYITLKSAISAKSNLTIAGQTAPGEGIGFKSGKISFGKSSNIIIRHIRMRPGSETASTGDVAINLYNAKNAIIDHCSIEFAPWNNIGGVTDDWQKYPVTDITFQNCLIADPTYQQFGAHCESPNSNWSWYYNIFANSHNRNPLEKVNDVFVNNVLYNYSAGYTTHTSTNFKHDIIGNYFIFGPASTGTDNTWFQVDKNQSIYYSGNMKDNNLDGVLNGSTTTPYWYQGAGTILSAPWSSVTTANPIYSAATAYRYSASVAGTFPHDEMDDLVMSQIRTLGKGTTGTGVGTRGPGSGLYTSQTQTGLSNNGYGTIQTGTKPKDTDNDGMPDFWEKTNGSDPAKDDAMKIGSDGYALIEKYINWLAEVHVQTLQNTAVDLNLSTYTGGFQNVSPTYSVSNAQNGTVTLLSDGHTARFTPTANFAGMASYKFTVTGSDNTSFTFTVYVLVEPTNSTIKPIKYVYTYDNSGNLSWTNTNSWFPKAVPSAIDTVIIRTGEAQITNLSHTGPVYVESGGTLRLVNGNSAVNDLHLQGGTLRLYTSNPGFTLTSTISVEKPSTIQVGSVATTVLTLAGTIKGSSDIAKTGVGVLEVSSVASGFTGNWIVTEGKLRIKSVDALGKCGIKVGAGAVLNVATPSAASIYSLVIDSLGKVDLDMGLNTEVAVLGKENVIVGTYNNSNRPLFIGSTAALLVKNSILVASGNTSLCPGGSVLLQTLSSSSYSWKNGTTQVGTAQSYTAATSGDYNVSVSNANGCKVTSANAKVTVSAAAVPTITTTTSTTICTGGSVTLTSSVGASYKWFNGTTQVGTAQTYTATTVGDYTVEVTNASGCKATSAKTTVTVSALPTATISTTSSTTICAGGSVLLTSSSGTSYKWFNGTTQVGTAQTYTATTAGDYTVEVTNAGGCKSTSGKVTVTVNNTFTATIISTGSTTLCSGESLVLTSSTGTSYKWFNGTTQVGTAQAYTASAAGDYTVEVTDANGCKATSTKTTVIVNATPVATISTTGSTTLCSGESVVLISSAAASYKWFNGTTQVGTSQSYTATLAGDYSVEVTGSSGCRATSAKTTVTTNTAGAATIVASGSTALCQGESVVLSFSSGASYKWFNGTTQVATTPTYTATTAGDYSAEVTNTNGCKVTSNKLTITVSSLPTAVITAATSTSICQGQSVMLSSSIGTSYKWFNGTTQVGTNQSYTAIGAGDYTVEVTNASGCKATSAKTTIAVSASPTAIITSLTPTSICTGESVTLTSSAGNSYKWYNGTTQVGTNQTYIATASGDYSVEVTNANGCKTTSAKTNVTVSALPVATITTNTSTTLCGGASVILTSSPGSSYKWYNGTTQVGTNQTFTATTAGEYTVEVSNASNCKAVSSKTVVTNATQSPVTIDMGGSAIICKGTSKALTANSGSSYKWYKGTTQIGISQTYYATSAGDYSVEVTNASGCSVTSSVVTLEEREPSIPEITADGPTTLCDEESVVLTCSDGVAYKWFNGLSLLSNASSTYTATQSGTYKVEVTDENGCKAMTEEIVVEVSSCNPTAIGFGMGKTEMEVFPNPFTSELVIQQQGEFNYQLFDSKGSLVESGKGSDKLIIGKDLRGGLYLLLIENSISKNAIQVLKE